MNGHTRRESLDPAVLAHEKEHETWSQTLTAGQLVTSNRGVISMRLPVVVVMTLSWAAAGAAAAPAHDVVFWRAVVHDRYTPPSGSDVPALAEELTGMLSSPDPELRDEIAYSTLTAWVYRQTIVDARAMRSIVECWRSSR
jgi:hypothetical protein